MMKRDFLLPYGFKWVGWLLLATSLPVGIWGAVIDFNYAESPLFEALAWEDTLINNYIVIGLWLAALFIGCSRERIEDEMIEKIRLNALLAAFYLQASFLIVATFVVNSLDYLNVMIYNLVTYPLLFVGIYGLLLWRFLKGGEDEE